MPPWNPILGHLSLTSKLLRTLPPRCHSHYLPEAIHERFPELGPIFYLDLWPFSKPLLVVTSARFAQQLTEAQLHKDASFRAFMYAFTEERDLVCMEGKEWKKWKSIFSPGFQSSHIMTLVPNIIQDVLIFRKGLREHSKLGRRFTLEDMSTKLTLDVIGRIVLDDSFNTQEKPNQMASALASQIDWNIDSNQFNPLAVINPLRPIVLRYNAYLMNRYIDIRLQRRYLANQENNQSNKSRSIVDLALDSYQAASPSNVSTPQVKRTIDDTFLKIARSQVKLFLFAGHDTTAGTICYIYYMLSRNPEALAKLRMEHNAVFEHPEKTATQVALQPHLLNQLPYTSAVIKETLRLFPPASLVRAGSNGFSFHDAENSRIFPTHGFMVWSVHRSVQRDPESWRDSTKFLPERWLVSQEDPLFPPSEGFRPFERGPRACIGQGLANTEMKLTLALTAREFNFISAYEELDRGLKGVLSVCGEKAYQMAKGSAHPRHGMPMHVKQVDSSVEV